MRGLELKEKRDIEGGRGRGCWVTVLYRWGWVLTTAIKS